MGWCGRSSEVLLGLVGIGIGRDEFVQGVGAGVPDVIERSEPIVCRLQTPAVEAIAAVPAVGADRNELCVGHPEECTLSQESGVRLGFRSQVRRDRSRLGSRTGRVLYDPNVSAIADRLLELGVVLPPAVLAPQGVVLPFSPVIVGSNRQVVSGHGPQEPDGSLAQAVGKVGADLTAEQGNHAARLTALGLKLFGTEVGIHARSAVGLAELPFSIPVEVEIR